MEATSKPGRVWLKLQFARTAIITNGAKFIFSTIRASTPSGAGKFPWLAPPIRFRYRGHFSGIAFSRH